MASRIQTWYPQEILEPTYLTRQRERNLQDFSSGNIPAGTLRRIGKKPNINPTRFVLSIKQSDDDKEVQKARFALGGHLDREKSSLVHIYTTLRHCSVRILIALAVILGFDVWSSDVTQAYLQSAQNLKRNVFVRPEIIELGADELLQVMKPLYSLI